MPSSTQFSRNHGRLGFDRRQRRFPVSGAGGRAQPGNRDGRHCDSRGGFAGAGKACLAAPLGQPGRTEPHHRAAASGRRQARGDGRAGEAQQNFQRHSSGLEAGQAAFLASQKEHRFADRRGGQRAGRGRNSAGGFHLVSAAADSRTPAFSRTARRTRAKPRTSPTAARSPGRSRGWTWDRRWWSATAPASPWRPWKAPTRPSSAPPASPAAARWWS